VEAVNRYKYGRGGHSASVRLGQQVEPGAELLIEAHFAVEDEGRSRQRADRPGGTPDAFGPTYPRFRPPIALNTRIHSYLLFGMSIAPGRSRSSATNPEHQGRRAMAAITTTASLGRRRSFSRVTRLGVVTFLVLALVDLAGSLAPLVFGLTTTVVSPEASAIPTESDVAGAALMPTPVVGPSKHRTDPEVASVPSTPPRPARARTPTPVLAIRVDRRRASLSVAAQEQPWTKLLTTLASESDIVVHLQPQPEGMVTVAIRDVSVERALKQLFGRDAQYIFRYEASRSAAVPVEVWVWRQPTRPADMPVPDVRSASGAAGHPGPEKGSRPAEIRPVGEQPTWTEVSALVDGLGDQNAAVRLDAVVRLAHLHDDSVVEALGERLQRENEPTVRAAVAETLATINSPPALATLRPALTDPDDLVRSRALEALVNLGGEPGLALLHEAARAGDEDAQHAVAASSALEHGTPEREEQR
jgi:hypothetical protein